MMLFIWCFVSTLAPYPMNSFFVSFFKFVRSIGNDYLALIELNQDDLKPLAFELSHKLPPLSVITAII